MDRPWFQFYSRDWLDSKELRRCSLASRAVLADLMCLAHEGQPYGHLADSVGPLSEEYLASRCVVSVRKLRDSLQELFDLGRLHRTDFDGKMAETYFIKRMVKDEETRLLRAAGGSKGGNPNIQRKVNHPSNLQSESEVNRSLARAHVPRSDSGSDSVPVCALDFELRFNVAFSRHKKNRGTETKQLVAQMLMDADWDIFDRTHIPFCRYWDRQDWSKCPVTMLEWWRNGMPGPPVDAKAERLTVPKVSRMELTPEESARLLAETDALLEESR